MITEKIRELIREETRIPKPKARTDSTVKCWGSRRKEPALIYRIPNYRNPSKPYEKGITESEFEKAFAELQRSGKLSRSWFNRNLSACAKEGGCNFTTIGGIFFLLDEARYSGPGIYVRKEPP